jgi:DNA-binding MarR family transcriptional regulator
MLRNMAEPRWLDDDEMRAWRAFVEASVRLFERLDRELKADHGLNHDDYAILVNLSEAPGQRMRMTELASRVLESKSRLSHHVGRLEAEGLVQRESCPNDLRGLFAVLTPAGQRMMRKAAPDHVRSVRHHFIDHLDRSQLRVLADALGGVAERLEHDGLPSMHGDCGGLTGPEPAEPAPRTRSRSKA